MHINTKILKEIKFDLRYDYSINISTNLWKLFCNPLTGFFGNVSFCEFKKRQKVAESIIRSILGLHGKERVVSYALAQMVELENSIQELQPWVRDHVVHAINTFILGVYILKMVEFPVLSDTRFNYPFIWKLCGPTHDLGYPIEIGHNIKSKFGNKINEILNDLDSISSRINFEVHPENLNFLSEEEDSNELIQQRLKEWGINIDIKVYYTWLEENNFTDHGVISALTQMKIIDAIYYKKNPKREKKDVILSNHNWNQENFDLDIVSSSAALFIHNISLKYKGFSNKVIFNQAPIAFLLFLCDTLQEWDRYSEKQQIYSGNEFDIVCEDRKISVKVPKFLEKKSLIL
ncbi:MAG: hypothetical protein ACTSQ8_24955 [Candidatus Helarchaeota archaeon]